MSQRTHARPGPAVFSKIFSQDLSVYSTAALAAGVGVLALASPAEGKVVVTTKTIHLNFNQVVALDLDGDKVTDVQFDLKYFAEGCGAVGSLTMKVPKGNGIIGGTLSQSGPLYVSALAQGAKIGPAGKFVAGGGNAIVEFSSLEFCSGSDFRTSRAKWGGNPQNRYVGVKFLIHGATHYGWIRLSANFTGPIGIVPTATITAYAYETVANQPIKAGSKPATAVTNSSREESRQSRASLGMLALGADGLAIWRKEETFPTL